VQLLLQPLHLNGEVAARRLHRRAVSRTSPDHRASDRCNNRTNAARERAPPAPAPPGCGCCRALGCDECMGATVLPCRLHSANDWVQDVDEPV
jgi:hypothetical protein